MTKPRKYYIEESFSPNVKGMGWLLIGLGFFAFYNLVNEGAFIAAIFIPPILLFLGFFISLAKTNLVCSGTEQIEFRRAKSLWMFSISRKLNVSEFKLALIKKDATTHRLGVLGQSTVSTEDYEDKKRLALYLVTSKNEQHILFKGTMSEIITFIQTELKDKDLRYFKGVVKAGQELELK